jgi:hypothetical protein
VLYEWIWTEPTENSEATEGKLRFLCFLLFIEFGNRTVGYNLTHHCGVSFRRNF